MPTASRLRLAGAALVVSTTVGCRSFGPKALQETRLHYNEVVKATTEQQLLLNIVRLRYLDTPSSLAVSSIAAQFELTPSAQVVPFFSSAGADVNRSFTTVLPQVGVVVSDRPTFSLTPLDDQEFTRKLFTPLTLDGIIYLAKTTWPIATVFRLYLENLNWVSNAQTASGPTPKQPPVYAEFLRCIAALQTLQDRGQIVFGLEERADPMGGPVPAGSVTPGNVIEAAKSGLEYRPDENGSTWTLIKKRQQPVLRVDPQALDSAEMADLRRTLKLRPGLTKYDITVESLSPFASDFPTDGVRSFDLETRSLLQALYFVAQGVDVPEEHAGRGLITVTRDDAGHAFDWSLVTGGLFHVRSVKGGQRPPSAHVAVQYEGYWFYIDDSDTDTKTTFSLLMELARLELAGKEGSEPLLAIPLGR
jgi:hypothetical protein